MRYQERELGTKLQQLLSFLIVLAQLGDVYRIRYPPGYATLSSLLLSLLRLRPDWFPGLDLQCFGIRGLPSQLWLYILLPPSLVVLA